MALEVDFLGNELEGNSGGSLISILESIGGIFSPLDLGFRSTDFIFFCFVQTDFGKKFFMVEAEMLAKNLLFSIELSTN